jgi:fimbrial chaperone protein
VNLKHLACAVLASAAILSAPPALATTVQPILLDLSSSGRNMTGVITVQNTSTAPMPIEIRVDQLKFGPRGAEMDHSSDDLLVFPVQAVIQPNQSQAFRVQWVGEPNLTESRSYYVTVAQAPVALPQGQSAVQVVYNFQTLVNVSPPNGGVAKLSIVSSTIGRDLEGKPVAMATIANESRVHGYIARGRIQVIQKDGAGRVVVDKSLTSGELEQAIGFGLVGPGQQRTVTLPTQLASDQGNVEVRYTPNRQ